MPCWEYESGCLFRAVLSTLLERSLWELFWYEEIVLLRRKHTIEIDNANPILINGRCYFRCKYLCRRGLYIFHNSINSETNKTTENKCRSTKKKGISTGNVLQTQKYKKNRH